MRVVALVVVAVAGCGGGSSFAGECGNALVESGEDCDDGNVTGRDGCSSTCELETCGNGLFNEGEECDDGNRVDGDGCSAECTVDDENLGLLTAEWFFLHVPDQLLVCPVGFPTMAIESTPVDAAGTATGPATIDLVDCDRSLAQLDLEPDFYRVVFTSTNLAQTQDYAVSLPQTADLRSSGRLITAKFFDDGGFFQLRWSLRGAQTQNALSCAQVPSIDSIEIASTLSSSSSLVTDRFGCAAPGGITDGLLAGAYVVSVAALTATGTALGEPQSVSGTIAAPNIVTDLGSIVLPIDGH